MKFVIHGLDRITYLYLIISLFEHKKCKGTVITTLNNKNVRYVDFACAGMTIIHFFVIKISILTGFKNLYIVCKQHRRIMSTILRIPTLHVY